MTINQIECFVEVSKAGNISRAAEQLFITQQAVSRQIRALEEELGFAVFNREHKGISLTKEGEILFDTWADVWEKLCISIDKARDVHSRRNTHVRVAIEDMGRCSEEFMMAFSEYEKKYDNLFIDFEILSPRQILNRFEADQLDIGILFESELKHCQDLKCLPIHEEKLKVCIYLSGSHPLAQKEKLTVEDIKDQPIGILNKTCSLDFKKQITGFFDCYGVEPPEHMLEYGSRRELEISLIAGCCVTIVYEPMFASDGKTLQAREIEAEDYSSRIAIFWKNPEMEIKARSLGTMLKEKLAGEL